MQKIRELDSLQGFMSSFKQFEKKLDKLQDDVNFHGNTLSELRTMVVNLATAVNVEPRTEEAKSPKKSIEWSTQAALAKGMMTRNVHENKTLSAGIQYEDKNRRPEAIRQMPNKLKAKSLQDQKYGLKPSVQPSRPQKKASLPVVGKHHRPRKAEAPRKATTLRQQKTSVKKRKTAK